MLSKFPYESFEVFIRDSPVADCRVFIPNVLKGVGERRYKVEKINLNSAMRSFSVGKWKQFIPTLLPKSFMKLEPVLKVAMLFLEAAEIAAPILCFIYAKEFGPFQPQLVKNIFPTPLHLNALFNMMVLENTPLRPI